MTSTLAVSLERTCWDLESVVQNLGLADAFTGELRHIREDGFEHDGPLDDLVPAGEVLRSYADDTSAVTVVRVGDAIATLTKRGEKWVTAHAIASTGTEADELLAAVRANHRPPCDPAHILPIDFSYECDGSARRVRRRLAVSAWSDIARNYSSAVRDSVKPLMTMAPPAEGAGRILLWHGPPGTGKTTAIRALMRAWRDWCEPMFVVDPDKLFLTASYLLGVVVDDDSLEDDRWRLLVIEDADELLRTDAKSRSGQALSRLLNLSDGLIGQGLRVLVMITTNEPLAELHPAVVRPGRCLSQVAFEPLNRQDACRWLGTEPSDDREAFTLAELFHAIDEQD